MKEGSIATVHDLPRECERQPPTESGGDQGLSVGRCAVDLAGNLVTRVWQERLECVGADHQERPQIRRRVASASALLASQCAWKRANISSNFASVASRAASKSARRFAAAAS